MPLYLFWPKEYTELSENFRLVPKMDFGIHLGKFDCGHFDVMEYVHFYSFAQGSI